VVSTASAIKNYRKLINVWEEISAYKKLGSLNNGYFHQNRNLQQVQWMYNNINEELKRLFYGSKDIASQLSMLEKDIISAKISPVKAAQKIIEAFKQSFQK